MRSSRWYNAWYFSRLNVCAAAAALTACSSRVLVGDIPLQAVLAVTLGTYVVYALDDVLDRRSDEARFPALRSLGRVRFGASVGVMLFALAVLVHLVVARGVEAPWPLLSQGCVSIAFCIATVKWPRLEGARSWPLVRALFVSLVWASACALTPVWWAGQPFSFRAVRGVAFLWQLMFVIILLWEDGECASDPGRDRSLADPITRRRLQAVCACSAFGACAGVALGHVPAANLSVIAASCVNLLAVRWWTRVALDGRLRNDLLVAANAACCLLVIAVHDAAA